jgi:hypothetical protein
MESLTKQLHRYIPESWKRITENATITDGVTDGTNRRYISESWKRITTNITAIVNALTKLQMVLCQYYVIITEGYTDEIIKAGKLFLAYFVCL